MVKMGCLYLVGGLFLVLPGWAAVDESDKPTGHMEMRVELPVEPPYVGEPLRLVLRSGVRGKIAADRIVEPALTNFDWQQFGIDRSSEEMIDGFWTPVVERVLMIYPLRPGRLTISPFESNVTYVTAAGERAQIQFESQPLEIDVRSHDSVVDSKDFWLPAKEVRITDRWEPEPDKIPFGEMAQRILTIEADGITADRLPPLPDFRAPGVITFAAPVERRTIITDQGPVGRAVYRWNLRPVSTSPAFAPSIRVSWFDIAARTKREAVVPEQRVAFVEAVRPESEAGLSTGLLSLRPLVAGLISFVSTFAAICLFASSKAAGSGRWRGLFAAKPAALGTLRRAAHRGDVAAFRRAIRELSKGDREVWRKVMARGDIAPLLATVDAALFGRDRASPAGLALLARTIDAAWKEVKRNNNSADDGRGGQRYPDNSAVGWPRNGDAG